MFILYFNEFTVTSFAYSKGLFNNNRRVDLRKIDIVKVDDNYIKQQLTVVQKNSNNLCISLWWTVIELAKEQS